MAAQKQPQQAMFTPPPVGRLAVGGADCPLLVGTCGYSYAEWRDCGFYPATSRSADMLGLYMRFFPIVELNYTWYQMPRAEAVQRMVAGVPADFRFAAKLTRTLTHERSTEWRSELRRYRQGIAPLGERLAAVLIQLPPDFDRSAAHRYYLAGILDGLQGLPVAVEFRHASWAVDQVYGELERRGVTLVAVDAPAIPSLFPSLDVVTNSDFFYVRFHGRNQRGWRSSNMQKKFDYDYQAAELQEWVAGSLARMASRCSRGYVFFNNHVRGQAPRNASLLQKLLHTRMAEDWRCSGSAQ